MIQNPGLPDGAGPTEGLGPEPRGPNFPEVPKGLANNRLLENLTPWVESSGDRMTGDLNMLYNSIVFRDRELDASAEGSLRWGGKRVCHDGINFPACGTVTRVEASEGLTGGPITGTGTLKVADGGITSQKLAEGSVVGSKLAADAVTGEKIADGAITDEDVAAAAGIGWAKVSKAGSSLGDLAARSASDLDSGTLADARLPANVARLGTAQSWTALQAFGSFADLDGSTIKTGIVSDARLPLAGPGAPGIVPAGGITDDLVAERAGIAYAKLALGGSISSGDIADATIGDADVSDSAGIAWWKVSKEGASLADLATRSAADLTSGVLPDARLEGTYTGALAFRNGKNVFEGDGAGLLHLDPANLDPGTAAISITGNAGTVTNGVYTSGTYADPAWLTALAGSKVTGNVAGNAAGFTGALAGDVSGLQGATTVAAIRGIPVEESAPTPGQVLKFEGGRWVPFDDANSGGTVTSVSAGAGLTGGPITGAGTISIATGGVTTPLLAANAVDGSKIADGAITGADVAPTATLTIAGQVVDPLASRTRDAGAIAHFFTDGTRGNVRIETTDASPNPDPALVLAKTTTSGAGPRAFALAVRAHNDQRFDVVDVTSNAVRLTIKDTGNVGIGTLSPQAKLDVAGDVRFSGTLQGGTVPWARLASFPTACSAGQFVTSLGPTLACATPPGSSYAAGTGLTLSGTTFAIATGGVTNPLLAANAVDGSKITDGAITGADIAPTATLAIAGQVVDPLASRARHAGAIAHFFTDGTRGNVRIETTDASPNHDPALILAKTTSSGAGPRAFALAVRAGGDQRFDVVDVTSNAVRLTIKDTGNVGIGTLSPQAKLDVAGDVRLSGSLRYGSLADWRLVHRDEFTTSAAGWSSETRSDCGGASILGGHGVIAGGSLTKTYDLSTIPHSEVMIRFAYYFGDSWDAEIGYAKLDSMRVWRGPSDYLEPGLSNVCGGGTFTDSLQVGSGAISHTAGSVQVTFGSNLDQQASDEWFGVDNVEVWVR